MTFIENLIFLFCTFDCNKSDVKSILFVLWMVLKYQFFKGCGYLSGSLTNSPVVICGESLHRMRYIHRLQFNPDNRENIQKYMHVRMLKVKGRTVYSAPRGLELGSQNEIGCIFKKLTALDKYSARLTYKLYFRNLTQKNQIQWRYDPLIFPFPFFLVFLYFFVN